MASFPWLCRVPVWCVLVRWLRDSSDYLSDLGTQDPKRLRLLKADCILAILPFVE
jgi:hypothetical protein